MNKQEATKQVEQMGEYEHFVDELISKKLVLNIISQIHEPQKVVVPKIVAEWLRKYQQDLTLLKVLDAAENELIVPSAVNNWILDNQRDFVVAWHDGYEIE
ncbi:TPA: DUF1642 domain-containing protein [Streptococcus suis]|nr:DUF1642 domain-containing protein [Streptococcus suis]